MQAFKNQYIEQYKAAGYPYDEGQVEAYAVQNAKVYMQQYAPQWCAFLPELAQGAQAYAAAAAGGGQHGAQYGGQQPAANKKAGGQARARPANGAPPPVDVSPGHWLHMMGPELVGQSFQTWWEDEGEWFEAFIRTYDASTGEHELVYDMDTELETQEFINLSTLKSDDFKLSAQLKSTLRSFAQQHGAPS